MTLKPPAIRRRKFKQKSKDEINGDCNDILSSSRIVEEAQRENMLHRGLSDMLVGCCTGLDAEADHENDSAFDITWELEELEKEISLAKEMKQKGVRVRAGKKHVGVPDASSIKEEPNGVSVSSSIPGSPQEQQSGAVRATASTACSSSSNSLLSSSASWTEQMSESVESNFNFLVGSCSSRQVLVDTMLEAAIDV